MKYMLIMRATDEAYAKLAGADPTEMIETVGRYNEELIRADVLGRAGEARAELSRAIKLCGNTRERAVLERKLARLD